MVPGGDTGPIVPDDEMTGVNEVTSVDESSVEDDTAGGEAIPDMDATDPEVPGGSFIILTPGDT